MHNSTPFLITITGTTRHRARNGDVNKVVQDGGIAGAASVPVAALKDPGTGGGGRNRGR